jgi:REP element-mobilizing transposase RayT
MAAMQELPKRKHLPHTLPAWVDRSDPFFVTICCKQRGHNTLAHPHVFQTIRETLGIYEEARKLKLFSLTVMPDHVHLIARWDHAIGLGRTIMAFKGILAKRHAIKWQQGFFDHRIRSSGELRAKTEYVRVNPVRAGHVTNATDWPYTYLCGQEDG